MYFQLLRIQSPEGTKRIEINPTDTTCQLFEKVHSTFDFNSFAFALYKQKNQKDEIASSKSRTVAGIGLHHGDMVYLMPVNGAVLFPQASTSRVRKLCFLLHKDLIKFLFSFQNNTPSGEPAALDSASLSNIACASHSRPTSSSGGNRSLNNIQEDEVDIQLAKLDGKIQRKRDDKL